MLPTGVAPPTVASPWGKDGRSRARRCAGLRSRDVWDDQPAAVIVPRGAKLIGTFGSDASQGQKRIGVAWDSIKIFRYRLKALNAVPTAGIHQSCSTISLNQLRRRALRRGAFAIARHFYASNDPFLFCVAYNPRRCLGYSLSSNFGGPATRPSISYRELIIAYAYTRSCDW